MTIDEVRITSSNTNHTDTENGHGHEACKDY